MGNCLRREYISDSSVQWGGDDWGSSSPVRPVPVSRRHINDIDEDQEKELLNQEYFSKSSSNNKEVKIKISKKQLKELLGRVDMKELSVEQVLAQLIKSINNTHSSSVSNGPWKPNLQSIPE